MEKNFETDVERIVNANFDRMRWAAEYADNGKPERVVKKRERNESRFRTVRGATIACAMFAGAAAAFIGIGLSQGDAVTVGISALVSLIFCTAGARMESLSRSV